MSSALPLCGGAAWASLADIPDGAIGMHNDDVWDGFLAMATDVLWAASGRRWRGAGCTATATLRAQQRDDGWDRSWGMCPCSHLSASHLATWSPRMNHHEPARIRLPHDDVTAVTSVTIDGSPVDGWTLDGAWLTRGDGCGWPICGDRTVITYAYGRDPPAAGRALAVELAVEFGRSSSASPDKACSLPKRLQSVTRQGINFVALDDLAFLDSGKTGLYAIDVWLASVNPKARAQAASVWSPDISYARRTS